MSEVLESLERPLPLSPIYEEFNMSPAARSPHNIFAGKIYSRLDHLLEDTQLMSLFDTFRYLDDWLVNSFGDFKNTEKLENNFYQPIPLENDGYFCETIGHFIPQTWEI